MHRWKGRRTEDQRERTTSESDGESSRFNPISPDQKFPPKPPTKPSAINGDGALKIKSMTTREKNNEWISEDLPDGSCFSRVLKIEATQGDGLGCIQPNESSVRKCEYVGSFPVAGNDHAARAEFVRTQLEQMRETTKKKPVLLVVALTGIKVCSPSGKSVYMAHALRRISYATCAPQHCQFSFLAREPNGHFSLQYCHSFLTQNSSQAEELSRLVGSAFRMAYAQQLHQPSFHDLIARQLEQRNCRQLHLPSGSSPPASPSPSNARPQEADDESPRATAKIWAKQLAGRTRHYDPMVGPLLELRSPAPVRTLRLDLPLAESNPLEMAQTSLPTGGLLSQCPSPPPMQDVWSPLSETSSTSSRSDNATSPTEVNCCSQLRDKPPLVKKLDVCAEKANGAETERPPSGGYVNEDPPWEGATVSRSCRSSGKSSSDHEHFNGHPPRKSTNFQICRSGQSPTAPPTDEENLLELSSDQSSKRSSHSSCDQSAHSLPDSVTSDDPAELSCCRGRRTSRSSSSNSSVTPPPPPERLDSLCPMLSEEKELRGAPWFQAGIPREIALEVLAQEPVGSFMVRESTSKPGCFALSLRVPPNFHKSGIAHYLIMRTNRGYKIKGFTKEFSTLTALITHHSVMPELLPCPLCLSRYNPTFRKQDSEDMVDIDEDPDYNLLSDFRKMMADLNV